MHKFLKEVSLLNQPFVKNDKQTVEQMLKAQGRAVKASRCSSSARASRRRRTISRPKWPRMARRLKGAAGVRHAPTRHELAH